MNRLLVISAVCLYGWTARAGASDFGCDEKGEGFAQTGTICLGLHIGTPDPCDPVCFPYEPPCWPGARLYLGSGDKYLSCTAGTAEQCCNGLAVEWDLCDCACVECSVGSDEDKPDYCNACTAQSTSWVVYTTKTCQRNQEGQPVGCQ